MKIYSIAEMSKKIHKSIGTLRRWDRQGLLVAKRDLTNHLYYTEEDVTFVLRQCPIVSENAEIEYRT